MVDEQLEILFEVHQRIGEEIGEARVRGNEDAWTENHINGLQEANNRVEDVIYETIEGNRLARDITEEESFCGCHE